MEAISTSPNKISDFPNPAHPRKDLERHFLAKTPQLRSKNLGRIAPLLKMDTKPIAMPTEKGLNTRTHRQ